MTEKPKWYSQIMNKYQPYGLGMVLISENGAEFLDKSGNTLSDEISATIQSEVAAIEFMETHKRAPRKWRSWQTIPKKRF